MKNVARFISCLIILAFTSVNAQKLHYELPENASKLYNAGNYWKALELYRDLYKKDLTDVKNAYHFGVCLIHTYQFNDGIETLEKVATKNSCPDEVLFHLAKGYHCTLRFDKAIDYFKKFIEKNPSSSLVDEANRSIEMCENAKILVKTPVNVSFENLGDRINSPGKDYLPYITDNESMLFFTTRREGTTGRIYDMEGYYTSDIYTAKYKYEKWSKPRSIGAPNSYGNEFTAGMSENGERLFYYVNNPQSKNNLQLSEKTKSSFKKAEMLKSKSINAKNSEQIAATLNNNNDFMIFSSNRDGGEGNFDLYVCKKLPNGKWAEPQNIGSEINTTYNENYPQLMNEGKTLYFASDGYNSMGGYDIFKSEFDEETQKWSKPQNIGYPLNTPLDDYNICFSSDNKYAYIASIRNDSYGDYDIYKVNFENEDPLFTTVKGNVLNPDSSVFNTPIHIEVFNSETGDLQGIYDSNEKGSFLIILPAGKYEIIAEIPSKGTFTYKINIGDRKLYKPEIIKDIHLNFVEKLPEQQ